MPILDYIIILDDEMNISFKSLAISNLGIFLGYSESWNVSIGTLLDLLLGLLLGCLICLVMIKV